MILLTFSRFHHMRHWQSLKRVCSWLLGEQLVFAHGTRNSPSYTKDEAQKIDKPCMYYRHQPRESPFPKLMRGATVWCIRMRRCFFRYSSDQSKPLPEEANTGLLYSTSAFVDLLYKFCVSLRPIERVARCCHATKRARRHTFERWHGWAVPQDCTSVLLTKCLNGCGIAAMIARIPENHSTSVTAVRHMAQDFARAFNKLHAEATLAVDAQDVELQRARKEEREEEKLRQREGPMTAADAVPRILQAWKDSDYFR